MLPYRETDGKYFGNKSPKSRQQKPTSLHEDNDVQKKLIHRDLERQRRQEMATLYASLRTLLPLEYIKGKRSISDHMNEAVKYIKHLEDKIKGLCEKRDRLKKLSNLNVDETEIISASADSPTYNVAVHKCLGGLEVLLSSSLTAQNFPLSRILDILLKEGLDVANCISTKVEQRQMYTIHLQVSDMTSIDPSALQRKLTEAILSSSNFPL